MLEADDLNDPWFRDCPSCGAEAKRKCRYVEGAKHNGWYHIERYPAPIPDNNSPRTRG